MVEVKGKIYANALESNHNIPKLNEEVGNPLVAQIGCLHSIRSDKLKDTVV